MQPRPPPTRQPASGTAAARAPGPTVCPRRRPMLGARSWADCTSQVGGGGAVDVDVGVWVNSAPLRLRLWQVAHRMMLQCLLTAHPVAAAAALQVPPRCTQCWACCSWWQESWQSLHPTGWVCAGRGCQRVGARLPWCASHAGPRPLPPSVPAANASIPHCPAHPRCTAAYAIPPPVLLLIPCR